MIHHDIRPDACTCGCTEFVPSGDFDDHYQVDIPEPKPEYHRFRRHKMECCQCGKVVQGRGEGELPGSHVGPRARLLACYARGYLGISLGKTCQLPLITLFQDAIGLAARGQTLSADEYAAACEAIYDRFVEVLSRSSNHPDVRRIHKRLDKYMDELFTFLVEPGVPADNNTGERDIRSVAAARSDGGVSRSERGAEAFATIKSVVRTCQKRGVSFFEFGMQLTRAVLSGQPPPLPTALATN